MRHRLVRFVGFALAIAAATACEFGEVTVAQPREQIVVHAVLNPGAFEQWILVERSRVGRVTIDTSRAFDPRDPIRTGVGVPLSGATVLIRDDDGKEWQARENGATGVYIMSMDLASRVQPGKRYSLLVRTPDGQEVTGTTTVPKAEPTVLATRRGFDRERDTLQLRWSSVPAARSYALRIDSPRGPFFLFVDSLSMRVPGGLRNFFADRLPRVFLPGFDQLLTLSAIDSNYYDYYRTRNDPFTGSGVINRLRGGIGLFGSIVTIDFQTLEVTAPLRSPLDGRYVLRSGFSEIPELRLWEETPAQSGNPAGLSGSWQYPGGQRSALLGTLAEQRVRLAFLRNAYEMDTSTVFEGELRSDSLIGRFRGNDLRIVYVRAPR